MADSLVHKTELVRADASRLPGTTSEPTPANATPSSASTAAIPAPSGPRRALAPVIAAILGLTAAVVLMLSAFVTPAINSGPHDLPIAVSGPAAATGKITAALEARQPGAFAVTRVDTAEQAAERIRDREAVGAISLAPTGVTIQTAGAAGTPYASALTAIGKSLEAQGQKVTYVDVVPLSRQDPTGTGLNALALPLAFGGMASAVVLSTVVRGGTHRSRTLRRVLGSIVFAALAGLAATALLQYGFGTFTGDYWRTSGMFALGIAAVSLTVLGLESLFGFVGVGIGGALMIFVANPLSGMATGAAWLPAPWGAVGQLLPIGAAGTAIRSAAFFDGRGATAALAVLGGWVVLGLALSAISGARARRRPASATAPEPAVR